MMTAKRVQQLGAGLAADYEKPAPDYRRLLRRILDEPAFTHAAQTVASQHSSDDEPLARVARIVDRLEKMMACTEPS